MAFESKPNRASPIYSKESASSDPEGVDRAQLSSSDGVETDVSTAAMHRGMLMGASSSPAPGVFSPMLTDGSVSDDEIMLRVKTGDQWALEDLVQSYRRRIVGFM